MSAPSWTATGMVATFGIVGCLMRHAVSTLFQTLLGTTRPYGALLCNMVGCFAIGVVQVLGREQGRIPDDVSIGVMVGLLGGLTTFSGFVLDTILLFETKTTVKSIWAAVNLLSVPIGFGITYLTIYCLRKYSPAPHSS